MWFERKRQKWQLIWSLLSVVALGLAGCSDDGGGTKRKNQGGQDPTASGRDKPEDPPGQGPEQAGASQDAKAKNSQTKPFPAGAGESFHDCHSKQKAWIPVPEQGPPVCGASLVKWCCQKQTILERFPQQAGNLKNEMQRLEKDGYSLYHCSKSSSGRFKFHYAKYSQQTNERHYWHLWAEGTPAPDASSPDKCPQVTPQDLGWPSDSPGGGGGDGSQDGDSDGGSDSDNGDGDADGDDTDGGGEDESGDDGGNVVIEEGEAP